MVDPAAVVEVLEVSESAQMVDPAAVVEVLEAARVTGVGAMPETVLVAGAAQATEAPDEPAAGEAAAPPGWRRQAAEVTYLRTFTRVYRAQLRAYLDRRLRDQGELVRGELIQSEPVPGRPEPGEPESAGPAA
jgi:hypothetical protein